MIDFGVTAISGVLGDGTEGALKKANIDKHIEKMLDGIIKSDNIDASIRAVIKGAKEQMVEMIKKGFSNLEYQLINEGKEEMKEENDN